MIRTRPLAFALLAACVQPSASPPFSATWGVAPRSEPLPPPARRFLVGNESRHDLFAAALADRRGALLGIGGDHCYTLIALADAEHAYLLDHDPAVVALHRELGRRIVSAGDPAALLATLATLPADPDLRAPWPAISDHLRRVAARPRTWLADPALYARARDLWRAGAVDLVVGDLAGDLAMPSIALAARVRRLDFTAVYLSNVEDTLADRRALLLNLAALPRRDDAVVLRTYYLPDQPAADGLWSYQVHALADLLARAAADDPPTNLAALVDDARRRDVLVVDPQHPGLSRIAL